MWDKSFRKTVFIIIYTCLFQDLNIDFSDSAILKGFLENLSQTNVDLDLDNFEHIQKIITKFYQDRKNLEKKLSDTTKDWNKTYLLVKAILFCYLLEEMEVSNKEKLLTKYLRLSQDYVGSKNVSLVHAIIAKVQS